MSVNQVPLIQSCVTPLNVVHHWRLEIVYNGSNQAVGQSFIVLSANLGAGSRHLPQLPRQFLIIHCIRSTFTSHFVRTYVDPN